MNAEDFDDDAYEGDIWICQGCGAYSDGPGWHVRNGQDCGEFL